MGTTDASRTSDAPITSRMKSHPDTVVLDTPHSERSEHSGGDLDLRIEGTFLQELETVSDTTVRPEPFDAAYARMMFPTCSPAMSRSSNPPSSSS
jgi:hypothetical protein